MNLANLNNHDYENLAIEILKIKDSSSEEQLIEYLGSELYSHDLEVTEEDAETMLVSSLWNEAAKQFNFKTAMYSPSMVTGSEQANFIISFKKSGKKLLKRIKKTICTSEALKELLTDSDKLGEKLKTVIPVILGVLTASVTLGPVGITFAVLVIAYLLKVGYGAYCSIS